MKRQTKRVLIGGLFHETHTFLHGLTRLSECQVLQGDEFWSARGDASPLGGALETAHECDWSVRPSIDLRAVPGPMVQDEVLDFWWTHFAAALRAALSDGLDGIFLVLHGAMVTQSQRDVEGEVLERIRLLTGAGILLGGVTDMHANFSQRMAAHSDALMTYRENPHTDARQTAVRAVHLLDRLMKNGEQAVTVRVQPPLMWPPTGTATADEPMLTLQTLARDIEAAHPEILAVNVHAGYSFADTFDSGVSFSAVTIGEAEAASRQLRRLVSRAMELKECGNRVEPSLDSALPRIKVLLEEAGSGPILLVEPSDNIGGGAPGDDTTVLRALIEHNISNAVVILNDPGAVEAVGHLPIGTHLRLPIGDKSGIPSGGPLNLEVELISMSDGKFELEDTHSHLASMAGRHIAMGPCAVLGYRGIRILLTSRKTPPFDLGQLRSQGIEPETLSVIGVKAAVAHRRAYDPIARASFTVSTPGPCRSNLQTFSFDFVRRPIYPLDSL